MVAVAVGGVVLRDVPRCCSQTKEIMAPPLPILAEGTPSRRKKGTPWLARSLGPWNATCQPWRSHARPAGSLLLLHQALRNAKYTEVARAFASPI